AGADAGDEGIGRRQKRAAPFAGAQEGHHRALLLRRARNDDHRIRAGQHAIHIAVAVAGARAPGPDSAKHGTGIAGNDAVLSVFLGMCAHGPAWRWGAASPLSGVAGTGVSRTPVACRRAPRMAGAVGISAGSPMPLAP